MTKVKQIVTGGATSQESIYNGLLAARELAGNENAIVLIHDAVRPLTTQEVISENIRCVRQYGNAITCGFVNETPIRVDDAGSICSVAHRSEVRMAQAPQSFWLNDVLAVHEKARAMGINSYVDSCTMMLVMGERLHFLDGNEDNLKITSSRDLYVFRGYLQAKEDYTNLRGGTR